MPSLPETDGFLHSRIGDDIARLHARFPDLFSLLLRCNRLAMAIRSQLIPDAGDQQSLLEATLFARGLQSLQAALLLAERGMVSEARTAVRSAGEAAIYQIRMSREATFAKKFVEDYAHSQSKLARAILDDAIIASTLSVEQKKCLKDQIAWACAEYPDGKPAKLNVADVAASIKLQSFYTSVFRRMSGDGVHTSIASLGRHLFEEREGRLHLQVGPQLDGIEDTLFAMVMVFMFSIQNALKSWGLDEWSDQLISLKNEWDELQS